MWGKNQFIKFEIKNFKMFILTIKAAQYNQLATVSYLLSVGANVNIRDVIGFTALKWGEYTSILME